MEKKDLKTGMIVSMKRGEQWMVMLNTSKGDVIKSIKDGVTVDLSNYNEDLTARYNQTKFDIVKTFDSMVRLNDLCVNRAEKSFDEILKSPFGYWL